MEVSPAGRRALSHDSAGTPDELFADSLGIDVRISCGQVDNPCSVGEQLLLRIKSTQCTLRWRSYARCP